MTGGGAQLASSLVMERLIQAAESNPRRIATLVRLKQACDDIVSGKARKLAERACQDSSIFSHLHPVVNSRTVDAYVRTRQKLDVADKIKTEWTGPTEVTIRKERDLMDYLKARQVEAGGTRKLAPSGTKSRRVQEIISSIADPNEQADLRFAIEAGLKAQRQLDLMREAVRLTMGVDVEDLLGKDGKRPGALFEVQAPLSKQDRSVLLGFLRRIEDDGEMRDFALRFDGARLKMRHPPGSPLIEKEEVTLLQRLAGAN